MPKQPMGTGIAVGLAEDQVITGRAVPLALLGPSAGLTGVVTAHGRMIGPLAWCTMTWSWVSKAHATK
jgi:hypothetical protein